MSEASSHLFSRLEALRVSRGSSFGAGEGNCAPEADETMLMAEGSGVQSQLRSKLALSLL